MKKHKLAKQALDNPELFTPAELAYFERWLRARKERKDAQKQAKREMLEKEFTNCDNTLL